MKILIVCSGNADGFKFEIHQSFIYEQIEALKNTFNIEYETFFIKEKGILGYLQNIAKLNRIIKNNNYSIVHAHYGLSGFISIFQTKIPVIITFHNGETLSVISNLLSSVASLFSKYDIYVAKHIYSKMFYKKRNKYSIVPCGIDLDKIQIEEKTLAQTKLNIPKSNNNVLFGGSFCNLRKNYPLAKQSAELLKNNNISINMIELKGYNREEVYSLLNACDLLLLPTKSEGSPQIIKEAMACNCPIVATDVGDIKEIVGATEGCYISSFDKEDVANKIQLALTFGKRTSGREKIGNYDNKNIAQKIYNIYKQVSKK